MKSPINHSARRERKQRRALSWPRPVWIICAILFSLGATDLPAAQPRVSHVVIIWLKHPGNAQDQETLIRTAAAFRRMRGVVRMEAGKAMPVNRTGIEQPFDVGIVITFKNRDMLQRFENNRRYQLAVEQVLKPLARRFVVYNSLVD